MENTLSKIFDHPDFGNLRIFIEEDGTVLFCGSDAAKALGYINPRDAITTHCRYVAKRDAPHPQSPDKTIEMSFIPEGDLYRLITHSKLPDAEKFERWVFDEVLPSIREHGAYMTPKIIEKILYNPDFIIRLATDLKEERQKNEQLEAKIEADQPKIEYYEDILKATGSLPITLIAKQYGMTAAQMNRILNDLGVQFKLDGTWVLYKKYADQGYVKMGTFKNSKNDKFYANHHTKWTQKGRYFLYNLLKESGYMPTIEKSTATLDIAR